MASFSSFLIYRLHSQPRGGTDEVRPEVWGCSEHGGCSHGLFLWTAVVLSMTLHFTALTPLCTSALVLTGCATGDTVVQPSEAKAVPASQNYFPHSYFEISEVILGSLKRVGSLNKPFLSKSVSSSLFPSVHLLPWPWTSTRGAAGPSPPPRGAQPRPPPASHRGPSLGPAASGAELLGRTRPAAGRGAEAEAAGMGWPWGWWLLPLGLLQLLGGPGGAACPCREPRLCQPVAGTGGPEVGEAGRGRRAGCGEGGCGAGSCPGAGWAALGAPRGLDSAPGRELATCSSATATPQGFVWGVGKGELEKGPVEKGWELMGRLLPASRSLCSMWGRRPGNPMTGRKLQLWQLSGSMIQSLCATLIPKVPG